MFDFTQVELEKIIVHKVGNKLREEGVNRSERFLELDDSVKQLLLTYFLNPFKTSNTLHNFNHESDLERNDLFYYSNEIFDSNSSVLLERSIDIAERLYSKSDHPKIKGGEFYVAFFSNCIIDDEIVNAIGLFKSENKETFLQVFEKNNNYEIGSQKGININRLDKGCLVFNSEKEKGYVVSIVDVMSSGKGNEAQYWKDFLKIKPREDEFYHTKNYIDVYKGFCEDSFKNKNEIDKREQVVLVNKAMEYFDSNENFDEHQFESEVIVRPELISSFKEYKTEFEKNNEIQTVDDFDISSVAVKDRKKRTRSVLKLDKSFHVYIHGSQDRIERGYDENKDLSYYKLFFEKES